MLSDAQQQELRDRFRRHWTEGVAFNKACGVAVARWDAEEVRLRLPFRDDLGAHPGVFHGGVISALIDTAGCGAVIAGHDFERGSRVTTIALSVQYFTVDPGAGAVAIARCTRRGRAVNFADVTVESERGKVLAQGLVTVSVSGERPEVVGPAAADHPEDVR
jgi:uncharacterized protein (TIGR00369 family)